VKNTRERLLADLGADRPFLCSLATVGEDGSPRVRFVRAKLDHYVILRVPTFLETRKVVDIRGEPRVHVTCGATDSSRPGTYYQIDGSAEISTEPSEREAAWTPRLSKWFSDSDDPNYVVVKVTPTQIVALPIGRAGEASIWRASGDPGI